MSLKRQAIRGALILILLKIAGVLVARVTALLLPLFLKPEDFGLVGLGLFFVGLFSLVTDFGLTSELIQRRNNIDAALRTAFTLRLVLSIGLPVALIVLAPFIATLYSAPQLFLIIVVLAATLPLSAFTLVPRVTATRRLDFKRGATPDQAGKMAGALLSIALAVTIGTYWSLVWGTIVGTVLGVVLFAVLVPWRPGLGVDRTLARPMLRFGGLVLLSSFAAIFAHSVDNALIGLLLSAQMLGFYLLAYDWAVDVPSSLATMIGWVSYPVLTKLRDEPERLRRGYVALLRQVAYFATFVSAGVFALAGAFVYNFYGDVWLPAVMPMRLLAVAGFLLATAIPATSMILTYGGPRDVVLIAIAEAAFIIVLMPVGILLAGLEGASLVAVGGAVLLAGLTHRRVARLLGLTLRRVPLLFLAPGAAASAAVAAVVLLPLVLPASLFVFLVLAVAYMGIYGIVLHVATRGQFLREFKELLGYLRRR